MRQVRFLIALLLSFLFVQVNADVKLPSILSSNMVLQRHTEFNIWGWADKNEKITVTFNGITRIARTGKDLKWMVAFPAMKAGGPYTMTIQGKNTFVLEKHPDGRCVGLLRPVKHGMAGCEYKQCRRGDCQCKVSENQVVPYTA